MKLGEASLRDWHSKKKNKSLGNIVTFPFGNLTGTF